MSVSTFASISVRCLFCCCSVMALVWHPLSMPYLRCCGDKTNKGSLIESATSLHFWEGDEFASMSCPINRCIAPPASPSAAARIGLSSVGVLFCSVLPPGKHLVTASELICAQCEFALFRLTLIPLTASYLGAFEHNSYLETGQNSCLYVCVCVCLPSTHGSGKVRAWGE